MLRQKKAIFIIVFVFFLFFTESVSSQSEVNNVARLKRVKAYVAMGNCNAASYELDKMRRDRKDETLESFSNLILISCYLEQHDYRKAQKLLDESFQSSNASIGFQNYLVTAAQAIKTLRLQIDRYKILGLAANDSSLPDESLKDFDKMREMLEGIIRQASSLNDESFFALLQEACLTRSSIAKDEYDATYWKELAEDMRDGFKNAKKKIDSVEDSNPQDSTASTNASVKPDSIAANIAKPGLSNSPNKYDLDEDEITRSTNPNPANGRFITNFQNERVLRLGSLVEYAIKKVTPRYPPAARAQKLSGAVKIELVVDENGKVASIKQASGHPILQSAALEAIKEWQFKPFTQGGVPVKVEGFVVFNFNAE